MTATRISGKPRKVPADDALLAALRQGETYADIGRRHGVDATCVRTHAMRLGWNPRLSRVVADTLSETPEKIVIGRDVLIDGRDFNMARILISLPRIPTLHGHFQGA